MASAVVGPIKKKATEKLQNIKVNVRVRPLSKTEIDTNIKSVVKCPTLREILTKEKKFCFDRVFKPEANQIEVYQSVVAPLIPDVIAGYNCTVFAYGQTGSGKTYTMSGDNCECPSNWREDPTAGCIPRAAAHIFEILDTDKNETSVKVSYLELYNEEIRDLLSDDESVLSIFDTTKTTIRVQGLNEICVNDCEELCKQLQKGNLKRQTAPTLMNHQSSRSHTVFTITVHTREGSLSGEDILKIGKINLVDLAGSENIARSGCRDARAVELVSINRSLLTLGRVIHALADKSQRHVPYRDSKLTRILKDSLGGHTKTCIIATVSPASNSYEETVSTLEYASRARDIKNRPIINETLTKTQMISNLYVEIERLRRDLDAAREKSGFFVNKENYQKLLDEIESYSGEKVTLEEAKERMQTKIDELDAEMKLKCKEFDDTVELCKKNKLLLERAKKVIKEKKEVLEQERYVAEVYEKEATVLHKKAETLLKTSEILSLQKDKLQDKLEKQYSINKSNEATAYETVNETLFNLNSVSKEEVLLRAVEQELNEACREDIEQLELAIRGPLDSLEEAIDSFTATSMKKVHIQEAIKLKLNAHMEPIKAKLNLFKDQLTVHEEQLKVFEDEDIPKFAEGYRNLADDFLDFITKMFKRIDDKLKSQDSVILDQLEDIERRVQQHIDHEEVLYRKRKEENQGIVDSLKAVRGMLKTNYTPEKDAVIFHDVYKKREKVKTDQEVLVNNLRICHIEKKSKLMKPERVEEIIDKTDQFSKELVAVAANLDADVSSNEKTVASLKTSLKQGFKTIKEGVTTKISKLNERLSHLRDKRKNFHSKLNEFMARTTQTLKGDFLNRVVPAKHEGDTPARQRIPLDSSFNCPPPREALLEKFLAEKDLDEDKENHRGALNVSALSFTSFESASEIDFGDVSHGSKP